MYVEVGAVVVDVAAVGIGVVIVATEGARGELVIQVISVGFEWCLRKYS